MEQVAVLLKTDEAMRRALEQTCPEAEFVWDASPSEEDIGRYTAVIGNVDPALLRHAGNLRLLQLNTAGVDAYADPALYVRPDVAVCSATGSYGRVISEYMLAAHLCLLKNLHLYRDSMARRAWEPLDHAETVADSCVLVLGAGDIGRQYAAKVRALGAYVIGVKQTPAELPEFHEVHTVDRLDELLPAADTVAMVLPGTDRTAGILSRERIFSMKRGAYLINAGRGSAVDQEALREALETGHLAGAAVDVTSPEPLPPESPLWGCRNLLITPHSAGGLRVRYTVQRILEIGGENLRAVLDGKRPARAVDLSKGY